jgi:muramoyltetrapeptide carboxypeptidase
LFALLEGADRFLLEGEAWVNGSAEGPLVGGNLTLLASLCGTRHQLDARGAILVLEDFAEAPYRIDRMLQQLRSARALDGIHGVVLGDFVKCDPPAGATWGLRDVLLDHLGSLGVPVLAGLPIGHGERNRAFVWGARARLHGPTLSVGHRTE